METSLHRALKTRFGPEAGGRSEVVLEGFRIDAIAADWDLIEVQSGALGPLRSKLRRLLPRYHVRVVKPVVLSRRVVRRSQPEGEDGSARRSSKRGSMLDVFDDLIGLARDFPDPHLCIEVIGVEIDEIRVLRRRRPGFTVADRILRRAVSSVVLREPGDLWALLPTIPPDRFTTRDLAERLGRSRAFAQRVAYCLRHAGAVETLGKDGRSPVYSPKGTSDGNPR